MQLDTPTLPPEGSRTERRLLTTAYLASFLLLGFAAAAEGPSLPSLADHTASALDRISLMFVTGSFGYLLGSIIGGRAFDRLPGHRVIVASLMLMLGAAVVYPLASVLWVLLLAAFIMGLGKGAVDVGGNTLLQWVQGAHAGPYLNGLHFAFGLGSFFSPIVLAQVLMRTHDIHWLFWTIGILIVPLAAWLWILPSPPSPSAHVEQAHLHVPFLPVLLVVLAFILYVGAEVGFSNWLYTYAITLHLADAISAAYLTSAFWASFTLGRLLGVWIATRAPSRTILFLDLAGCLLSVGLMALAADSVVALWIGSVALGLSMASIFPTVLVLASERIAVTGTVTGWFLVGSGAGGMLLPWLIGNAFTLSGPRSMLGIVLVDLVLNLLVLLYFMYRPVEAQRETISPSHSA